MAKTLQHQIIQEALHLIAEEEHWTRCSMARNSEGDPCSVWDPAAVRFCAVGALWRAANEFMDSLGAFELVETIAKRVVEHQRPNRLFANVQRSGGSRRGRRNVSGRACGLGVARTPAA